MIFLALKELDILIYKVYPCIERHVPQVIVLKYTVNRQSMYTYTKVHPNK